MTNPLTPLPWYSGGGRVGAFHPSSLFPSSLISILPARIDRRNPPHLRTPHHPRHPPPTPALLSRPGHRFYPRPPRFRRRRSPHPRLHLSPKIFRLHTWVQASRPRRRSHDAHLSILTSPTSVYFTSGKLRLPMLKAVLIFGGLSLLCVPLWSGLGAVINLCIFPNFPTQLLRHVRRLHA